MSLALKLALSPLLVAQAVRTRRRTPRLPEAAGARQGRAGQGPALSLLIAGDSSAAGVGVAEQSDALSGQLVAALAAHYRVDWRLLARSGLTTEQVLALLEQSGAAPADVAVVVSGVNDVVEQVPSQHAVAARERLVAWLRNRCGVMHVVFAPLPPMRGFPALPQPLRWVAGRDAERHDQALARWAASRADVSRVPMRLQPDPAAMADDGFHPGAPACRRYGQAIAGHIVAHVRPHPAARILETP
jgi:lysophospholipase L1-like esterase